MRDERAAAESLAERPSIVSLTELSQTIPAEHDNEWLDPSASSGTQHMTYLSGVTLQELSTNRYLNWVDFVGAIEREEQGCVLEISVPGKDGSEDYDLDEAIHSSSVELKSRLVRSLSTPAADLRLVYLKDVIFNPTTGVALTSNGQIISESVFAYLSGNTSDISPIAQIEGFFCDEKGVGIDDGIVAQARPVSEPSLIFTHAGARVFGHWMFDCLPVLASSSQAILDNGIKIVMPGVVGFQGEHLGLLGLRSNVEDGESEWIKLSTAIVSNFIDISNTLRTGALTSYSFSILRQKYDIETPRRSAEPRRLFVSRSNLNRRRRLVNEAVLERALANIGFETIRPEELPLREQANAFRNASVVVAPVGSGNINLGFCQTETKVVEIIPSTWVDHAFCRLSVLGELDYNSYYAEHYFKDAASIACSGYVEVGQSFCYYLDLNGFVSYLRERTAINEEDYGRMIEVLTNSPKNSDYMIQRLTADSDFIVRNGSYERFSIVNNLVLDGYNRSGCVSELRKDQDKIVIQPLSADAQAGKAISISCDVSSSGSVSFSSGIELICKGSASVEFIAYAIDVSLGTVIATDAMTLTGSDIGFLKLDINHVGQIRLVLKSEVRETKLGEAFEILFWSPNVQHR